MHGLPQLRHVPIQVVCFQLHFPPSSAAFCIEYILIMLYRKLLVFKLWLQLYFTVSDDSHHDVQRES